MDASKINLFVSWKPDRVDREAERLKLSDDPESLRQLGQKLESVQRVWKSYIVDASRGEILPRVGDGVDRAQLPADCLAGLEKVRQQAGQWLQGDVSMGVGMSMQEADRALQISRFRGGDAITLWDEETMQPELEEAHKKAGEEAVKDLSKADEPKGPKEAPKNKGNAGGGFSGRSEPGAEEKPMAPIPEGSEHSMGEVAAHEMSARPAVEGTHSGDLEEEFHDHAQAQEQGDQEEAEAKNRYADTRQKVVQILTQVKQAAPQLEQLKQQAPGLYQVLMEMTQALVLLGKSCLESEQAGQEEPQQDENVQKNERLNKAWEDPETQAQLEVMGDAVMEGRGQVLGDPSKEHPVRNRIAKPHGADPKAKRAVRSENSYTETEGGGWELSQAAQRRAVDAHHANVEGRPHTPGAGYELNGDEPADSRNVSRYMGRPLGTRSQTTDTWDDDFGGWQGPGPSQDGTKNNESRYWEGALVGAQARAFPIPNNPIAEGRPGGPGEHTYDWQFNPGNEEEAPSWGIQVTGRQNDPRYAGARPMSHVGGYFQVDPQTGLTGQFHNHNGYDENHIRAHLDKYLASLNGMHKKELEAALEKAKLPMPENAPKHTHVTWPTGWTKGDGRIKVAHPNEGGKTSWVSVRRGQVLSNDGHAISSGNPSGR